jgi:ABC-type transport system involved in cytochrome bd biosynthesis fused ATPase/permease subunit
LRNVNLEFPKKKLSVISGKTGSGKSLLLASILGEADLLSGTIEVPKSSPICGQCDCEATPDNWIIQSSITFVAQVPWIENAMIKENIVFDLPFNSVRYQKVINACALQPYLRMLVDGELTEIGANGMVVHSVRVAFYLLLHKSVGPSPEWQVRGNIAKGLGLLRFALEILMWLT